MRQTDEMLAMARIEVYGEYLEFEPSFDQEGILRGWSRVKGAGCYRHTTKEAGEAVAAAMGWSEGYKRRQRSADRERADARAEGMREAKEAIRALREVGR